MGSKRDSLKKRIRETIYSLSDEDLANLQHASAQNYTPFARMVLEEELTRRKRLKAVGKDPQLVGDGVPAILLEPSARHKTADCFIEVWSDKNFDGEYLKLEGPGEYQRIESISMAWGDCISSLRVGPSAFVLVYAEKEFRGSMISFGPGQQVPDLQELNFNDQIDSMNLVNSIKVFDGFKEDAGNSEGAQGKRPNRGPGRPRKRGG